MTIEIRQLVIRAIAEARPESAPRSAVATNALPSTMGSRSHAAAPTSPQERRALVTACVREVLRELRKSRER